MNRLMGIASTRARGRVEIEDILEEPGIGRLEIYRRLDEAWRHPDLVECRQNGWLERVVMLIAEPPVWWVLTDVGRKHTEDTI